MPATRKRTQQTRRNHSSSPATSTSTDHHHLRHTGPSIGERRASTGGSSSSSKLAPPFEVKGYPSNRKTDAREKPTSLPEEPEEKASGSSTPSSRETGTSAPSLSLTWNKFAYILTSVSLLLLAWYLYGMVTLLERVKDEVGWWGIVMGEEGGRRMLRWEDWRRMGWGWVSDPELDETDRRRGDLERSLNALADALGVPPLELASAVKPLVPQASLSSAATKESMGGASEAVRLLFEDTKRDDKKNSESRTSTRIMQDFVDGFKARERAEDFTEADVD